MSGVLSIMEATALQSLHMHNRGESFDVECEDPLGWDNMLHR